MANSAGVAGRDYYAVGRLLWLSSLTLLACSSNGASGANGGAGGTANTPGSSSMQASGGHAGTAGGARSSMSGAAGSSDRASSNDAGSSPGNSADAGDGGTSRHVQVAGRQLLVDGQAFQIRGVGWNPVPTGGNYPADLDYAGFAPTDIPLMAAAGINVVRTYDPLLDRSVLDQLYQAGIFVIESIYPYGGDDVGVVTERVHAIADHPAVLIWAVGNEWNYNGLYVSLSAADSLARLRQAAQLVKQADPNHPVATIYGEVPPKTTVDAMPEIDLWGINAYRGLSFGDLFTTWASTSDKPIFLAEYGADAYNANIGAYDPDSQALADKDLSSELLTQSTTQPGGIALGGA
ncbi:MAG TPA: glycoside hydrolase family 2 TIM barrel-domain containing protein, partial [Polyangiaceae bacterium]|nr:glycoside hydrolase family 2 TIM barrel-domain containing protein [Polyangiaceae bacterium]